MKTTLLVYLLNVETGVYYKKYKGKGNRHLWISVGGSSNGLILGGTTFHKFQYVMNFKRISLLCILEILFKSKPKVIPIK